MESTELIEQFRQELTHCQQLFRDGARQCIESHPRLLKQDPPRFRERMRELERGLLVKILVEIAQSDWHWNEKEYVLAGELFEHCWKRRLSRAELKEALKEVSARSSELSWDSLFRPFVEFPVLADLLTTIEPADIMLPDVPEKAYRDLDLRTLRVSTLCPGCNQAVHCQAELLGRRVQCKHCGHGFQLDWAELDR